MKPRARNLQELVDWCEEKVNDLTFQAVGQWKAQHKRPVIGHMPIWSPRELVHASGCLPVAVFGGSDRLEIIKGDAYFQSYICHIPRSTIELGLSGRLDAFDGMLFPSICDVIRNLSGMWKILFPDRYTKYIDMPQNFDAGVGGAFFKHELTGLLDDLGRLSGHRATTDDLRRSISLYNENRRLISELDTIRSERSWELSASEAYLLVRAGSLMDVAEHNEILREAAILCHDDSRPRLDNARVAVTGAFCEQPPLGLIRSLEKAGCDIVWDDFLLGSRWLGKDIPDSQDPLGSLVDTFLRHSARTASMYEPDEKGAFLVETARSRGAEGVVFCAPSFCDPALLDQPMLQTALDAAGIAYTSFRYSEDTGQFGVIREQAGTFADSIKLWSGAPA
ncbi:MAG: benzoyl-CoA reductase subunit C [Planctomycetota bacterium]